ncbi:hypothetical protein SAMN04488550_4564 [Gordonia malaquae]|uniref:Uncharacterized protein n=1 Tax=Gordonia malaquae NBRC 108250 TaxID=1223542 RepID=M3UYE3_GORML|nr:hypothetical protein [Gordonia malaquae]GAC80857.1 hypothetical protein GM1_023_00160 [Gordonia malaquae NBRC 108250]SEB66519.1 hypothetical protein SAMN04488550_0580 [Gordonia malaquae]SEE57170.1 hypothetical protein SAMN04488550_4564 [Gordonia malaquae]
MRAASQATGGHPSSESRETALELARAAGRKVGKRLARNPLTDRQRRVLAATFDGAQ